MKTLKERHAVHGGYIQIQEDGEDREGWNLVLVRPPEEMYGEWYIVETELSALTGRTTRYKPIATNARLVADNSANHWARVMHIYNLKDRLLERADILEIFRVFIPNMDNRQKL